jgi:hypothetical protein
VVFEETRSEVTARELIRLMRDTATADSAAFLRALPRDGTAVQVADIEREARFAGLLRADQPISQCNRLREARIALEISVKREGFAQGARWLWKMEGVGGSADFLVDGIACATYAINTARSVKGCGRGVTTQWRNCGAP